jgi:hypothetical protein
MLTSELYSQEPDSLTAFASMMKYNPPKAMQHKRPLFAQRGLTCLNSLPLLLPGWTTLPERVSGNVVSRQAAQRCDSRIQ